MPAFDLETILARVAAFAAAAPKILRRAGLTADLADEVATLMENADSPFAMAVVGQMRSGKSTIINALVGEDLAITDVNETTATVNWLKHGTGEQARTFRVVWRSELAREPEVFDQDDLRKWVGDSELARRTRYLEIYSTAKFLREIQVVDTPGTRSVLRDHEDTVRGFLAERHDPEAERHERETHFYGGAADCIVYVLNPVARESDAELLEAFESRTRLPGGSPYNSVAVVHKWESLEHDDPLAEAGHKAEVVARQLRRYVADVIPVSGPLGRAVWQLADDFWDRLAAFVAGTPEPVLRRLISGLEGKFDTRDLEGSALDAPGRRRLREGSGLPWPCFRVVINIAGRVRDRGGKELRAAVSEASGMERLMDFLQRRFFDRSRVIRAFNLLGRALRPCEVAIFRMREHARNQAERRGRAEAALGELGEPAARFPGVRAFLTETVEDLGRSLAEVDAIQRDLEDQIRSVREDFEHFGGDLEAIRTLDDHPNVFPAGEHIELLTILGAYGTSRLQRLACYAWEGGLDPAEVGRRLSHWVTQSELASGPRRRMLRHTVARLQEAAIGDPAH